MDKQMTMFGIEEEKESLYTKKIEAPIYEPSHKKPHILELCDGTKVRNLVEKINESSVTDEEKRFLRQAACRHAVFHYEKCADYYAHASPEMQRLMEESALVIIDFESAIEKGYVKLCESIRTQYLEERAND